LLETCLSEEFCFLVSNKHDVSLKFQNETGLKALMTGGEGKFSDVIEMAAKFQPTGNTLDTTNVKTKVPNKFKKLKHQ
jgi:hypothetical protein